ncbi:hypothetical protein GCM10010392_69120 [Streptomyces clavifer]|nr:hypothetical protein GCM10010392_69120 [Streptomyces clavifer]
MVEQYEERDCSIRFPMLDLSVDQSRTSEASRSFATLGDSTVEVGTSHDGFYLGFAKD